MEQQKITKITLFLKSERLLGGKPKKGNYSVSSKRWAEKRLLLACSCDLGKFKGLGVIM